MIEVQVLFMLSDYYVVEYGGTRYLLTDQDIFFQNSKAYTFDYKLRQRY